MKRIFAILLVLLLSASLFVACTNDNGSNGTDTNSNSSTDDSNVATDRYNYDMTSYVTLASYLNYAFNVELDVIQASIDSYLMDYAKEYVVNEGDDICVDIKAYEVVYSEGNGTNNTGMGDEILALAKTNYLIENIGSGSYAQEVEATIIGTKIGAKSGLRTTLPEDFYDQSWAGKEVFIHVTVASRQCKAGDVVQVSYDGYLLDEEGNRAEKFDSSSTAKFFLGSHLAIEDFEAGIAGMLVGEKKAFKATFPQDYVEEQLRGETVEFEVTLNAIYIPPAYDNAFASEHLGFDTTAEFEQDLKNNMVLTEILNYILDNSTIISYPETEYNEELKKLEEMEDSFAESYGISLDSYLLQVFGTTREEYVKGNMKSDMIYYSIAKKEGITFTTEQIEAKKQELIDYYTNYYISDAGLSETRAREEATILVAELGQTYIRENLLFDLVEEYLIKNAKVTYVEKTYTSVTETQNN